MTEKTPITGKEIFQQGHEPSSEDETILVRRSYGETISTMRLTDMKDEHGRRWAYSVGVDDDGREYVAGFKPVGEAALTEKYQDTLAGELASERAQHMIFEEESSLEREPTPEEEVIEELGHEAVEDAGIEEPAAQPKSDSAKEAEELSQEQLDQKAASEAIETVVHTEKAVDAALDELSQEFALLEQRISSRDYSIDAMKTLLMNKQHDMGKASSMVMHLNASFGELRTRAAEGRLQIPETVVDRYSAYDDVLQKTLHWLNQASATLENMRNYSHDQATLNAEAYRLKKESLVRLEAFRSQRLATELQ